MNIRTRYASIANGKAHIVPLIGRKLAHETFCGKCVQHWETVTDEAPADVCVRCAKVQEARGWARALQIVRAVGGEHKERRAGVR